MSTNKNKNVQKEQVLQSFGLTEAEIKLYIELLKSQESTASTLAKKTNTNRTFTYDRIKKLLGLGLANYIIKDNKKYFKATEPRQLLSILKEREEQVESILPELESLNIEEKKGPEIEVFSSKNGIRTALNILLKQEKEILIHGSIKKFQESMQEYYEIWNTRRIKQKIHAKILTTEEITIENAEIDLLTEEESSITTFTTGNIVIITVWSDIPIALMIESNDVANNNKNFFNNLWNREIKIYTGITGIRRAWMELVSQQSSELAGYGFSWNLAQIYGREFSNQWHQTRIKNKIPTRIISYDDNNSTKYFQQRNIEWENFNIQFLSKDLCGPACITMSDKIIVEFLYTEKNLKVIISKNKEMINIHKKHFENLWKKSTK